jgi:hypothetical protein
MKLNKYTIATPTNTQNLLKYSNSQVLNAKNMGLGWLIT